MRKIETVKKELFDRVRSQVADRLGAQDKEIQKTERRFVRFFNRKWKKCSIRHLQSKIDSANVIFWGDFHGVRQFQKNLLRWLKKQDLSKSSIVVALECLPTSSQKWVDQYLSSFISEEEFLEKVRWNKVWGFPWSHYKPIFDWVREKKQKLQLINGPKLKSTSRQREKWGVEILAKLVSSQVNTKVFVLYGEYHLLPKGFPSIVNKNKKLKPLYIFQNSDSLYFQRPPSEQSAEGEFFKSGLNYFCIQNVSPWVKWQNYNLFLESSSESEFEEDLDLTEHVLGLSQILSQTFQMKLDPNHYAVFTSADRALWDHLKKLPEDEFRLFEGLIEEGMSFVYLPGGWAFLGRISANESASLATQALLFQYNPKLGWSLEPEQLWNFLIWIHAFSYFGSKLINPHRKTPSLVDLQKKSRLLSGRPVERQAARLAVHYTLHQSLGSESSFSSMSLSDGVRFQAVKWISSLLGEKLFNAYNQRALSLSTLKAFLSKNPRDKNFHVVIQNLYEAVDGY